MNFFQTKIIKDTIIKIIIELNRLLNLNFFIIKRIAGSIISEIIKAIKKGIKNTDSLKAKYNPSNINTTYKILLPTLVQ